MTAVNQEMSHNIELFTELTTAASNVEVQICSTKGHNAIKEIRKERGLISVSYSGSSVALFDVHIN